VFDVICMPEEALPSARAAHTALRVDADGTAWIEAFRCGACGAVVPESSMACRRCDSRIPPSPFRAAENGRLYTWSIIERSYPGVAVPFVSAIIDLDGGPTLKGTLRGVATADLVSGLPVQVCFDDAGGAVSADGVPFVGFHFEPVEGAGA
jgi:uncharacterized protein